MKANIGKIGILLVIFGLLFSNLLCAQDKTFSIEPWEARINKRQPPEKILDAIGARPGMVIGEVGAGSGRMTLWLAQRVGKKGSIYANDINRKSLQKLKARCRREGFNNVRTIAGEISDPRLPVNTFDMVFLINVYHHLDSPVPLIKKILPSLKLRGYLAIVECDPDKVNWGKEEGCNSKTDMIRELGVKIITFLNEDNIYIAKAMNKLP